MNVSKILHFLLDENVSSFKKKKSKLKVFLRFAQVKNRHQMINSLVWKAKYLNCPGIVEKKKR